MTTCSELGDHIDLLVKAHLRLQPNPYLTKEVLDKAKQDIFDNRTSVGDVIRWLNSHDPVTMAINHYDILRFWYGASTTD